MSDLLADFQTFFISAGLTTLQTCTLDTISDNPDGAVAIYEYQGNSDKPQVDGVMRRVQIVTRDKSPTASKVKADELYKSLDTESGIFNLTPERWGMLLLLQPPYKFKVDGKDRSYFCFNLEITTYND